MLILYLSRKQREDQNKKGNGTQRRDVIRVVRNDINCGYFAVAADCAVACAEKDSLEDLYRDQGPKAV